MKLIGNYVSPYVRRVAISLSELGMPFELDHLFVFKSPELVREHNPVTRIPVLLTDDGEALVESFAILDYLDDLAGPDRALIPATGTPRRQVMQIVAQCQATMEKAQWAFYETMFRPPEKVHQPWIEHNENQVLAGFGLLNDLAREAGEDRWLGGTDRLSQADISAAVTYGFVHKIRPQLIADGSVPHLARFAGRCEERDSFVAAPIPSD